METSKKPALLALGRILREVQVPYAIIGGVAVQVHQDEARTTLDIDIAVPKIGSIPRDALVAGGFRLKGSFPHFENWIGSDGTPVQFTDDSLFENAIAAAIEVLVEGLPLRVIRAIDLLHAKLRAGSDPARRGRKDFRTSRMQWPSWKRILSCRRS